MDSRDTPAPHPQLDFAGSQPPHQAFFSSSPSPYIQHSAYQTASQPPFSAQPQNFAPHLFPTTYLYTSTSQPTFVPHHLHQIDYDQQQQSAYAAEMRPSIYSETFGDPLQNQMHAAQVPQAQGQQAQMAVQQNQQAQMAQFSPQVQSFQRLEAIRRANQGRTQQGGQAQQWQPNQQPQQAQQTLQMQQSFNPTQFAFNSINLQVPGATWQPQGMVLGAQSPPSGLRVRSPYATPPSSQASPASNGCMRAPAVQQQQGHALRTSLTTPTRGNNAASSIDLRTPPPSQERKNMPTVTTPRTASGQLNSSPSMFSAAASALSGTAFQTPSTRAHPVRIPVSHLTPPNSQGRKRTANDAAQSSPPAKRHATVGATEMSMANVGNAAQGQVHIVNPAAEYRKQQLLHQQQQAQQSRQQQVQKTRDVAAAELEKKKAHAAEVAAERKKHEEHFAAQAAEAEKKRKQAAIEAAEKKRKNDEYQARADEQAEQLRVAQALRLESERKCIRMEELRKDPSALFRHYTEYLQLFPLGPGEFRNRYHAMLLANDPFSFDQNEEKTLAVQYAKDNWQLYLQYPKDLKDAAQWQREALAKRAGTAPAVNKTASKV